MDLHRLQNLTKSGLVFMAIAIYSLTLFLAGKATATNEEVVQGATIQRNNIIENPIPSSDFQSPEVKSASVNLCSNTHYGFEISYEPDWFSTYNTDDQKCLFFAPYTFVVPHFIDGSFVPVNLEVFEPDDWLSTIKFYENPNDFFNVSSTANVEISGRLVKKIEATTTGKGALPRGFQVMHLLVFDGEKPVRLSYTQLDENEDPGAYKEALLNMVENIKYF